VENMHIVLIRGSKMATILKYFRKICHITASSDGLIYCVLILVFSSSKRVIYQNQAFSTLCTNIRLEILKKKRSKEIIQHILL
jgi:hypothetical protein